MGSCLKRKNLIFNSSVEPEVCLNRTEIKKWLQLFTDRLLPMNLKVIGLFYGEKGSGKTHILRHIQSHLIKRGEPVVAYIDLRKVTSEFDFYLRILLALSTSGFIEELLNEISNLKDALSINQLTGGNRIGWISKQFGFVPEKINSWFYGQHVNFPGRWIDSPKGNSSISRAVLNELIRAFYKMHNRRFPVFLIDHVEDVVGEKARNYMSEGAKEETIKNLNTIGASSTVLFSVDLDSYSFFRQYFASLLSSDYYEFELHYLAKDDCELFLSELRSYIVDTSKLLELDLGSLSQNEKVTSASYPLTEECADFIKNLKNNQPGLILSLLSHALGTTCENINEVITRTNLEVAAKKLSPYNLVVCKNCNLKLKLMYIDLEKKFNSSSKILNIKCPVCNSKVEDLLPFVLDKIVVDTCALVDCGVSALFEYFPHLGECSRVIIYIPKAVINELANWEKRMEMRSASRSALGELHRIQGFIRRKQVIIEENVGREPTQSQIASASQLNTIDRIIIEIADNLNATLLTCDRIMAEQCRALGVFSILFSTSKNEQITPS